MNELTKRLLACLCVGATVFACACDCNGNDGGTETSSFSQTSTESVESTEIKTFDENSFEGTYTATTAEAAATFLEGLKNGVGIGSPKWWNDYLEKNGGGQIIMEISSTDTKGYMLKDSNGLFADVKTAAQGEASTTSYYLADGIAYQKIVDTENQETKRKFPIADIRTNAFWQGFGLYDISGHIYSLDPYTGIWNPSNSTRDSAVAYYMDATDNEYVKMQIIVSNESYKNVAVFICKNDYIIACNNVRTNLATGEAFIDKSLLPWSGTIEQPTDLDTYTGA